MRTWLVLAGLAGMQVSGSLHAEVPIFQQCDGYGTPTLTGDGMTKPATGLFGLMKPNGSAGNTLRVTPSLGSAGVAACDQALADPRLRDDFWLRRTSLLRARAIHDLASGSGRANLDQALVDLDRAVAAVRDPAEPFYQRSLGLGLDLVRAFTIRQRGEDAKAKEIVARAYDKRTFNRQVLFAMQAAIGDDRTPVSDMSLGQALARLDPRHIDAMFIDAFYAGNLAQVLALHPHLVAPLDTPDIGVGNQRTADLQAAYDAAKKAKYDADRLGRLAYAKTALGQAQAARQLLADAKTRIERETPARLEPDYSKKEGGAARTARAINSVAVVAGAEAAQLIEDWTTVVALRADIDNKASVDIEPLVNRIGQLPRVGAPVELLEALQRRWPTIPELNAVIAERRSADERQRRKDYFTQVKMLFEGLPHTEMAGTVAPYKKAKSDFAGYMWGGISGFKLLGEPTSKNLTVQFLSEYGSPAVTEELALLRAADVARSRGYSGFVIVGRRDYQRSESTMYYGTVLRTDPTGYMSQLDVELMDRDAMPDAYKSVPWRVINVDAVIASLGPAYNMPAAVAAAQ